MRQAKIDFNVDDTQPSLRMLLHRVREGAEPGKEPLKIDLASCGFLGPSAVVTLCGLHRTFGKDDRTLTIEPPTHDKLRNYCQYSGLLAEFSLGPQPEDHPASMTTPLRGFETVLPTTAIGEVVSLARRSMQLSQSAEHDLTLVLSELIQNVLDHSRSEVGGFLSARAYKEVRDVRFAVADFGVGIRASLAARVTSPNDKEAIRLALQEEVTGRTSPRNLGLGLSHLHAIVRRTAGRMVIYSRQGFLKYEGGRDTLGLADVPFPGTIVFVRLPLREGDDQEAAVDIWG